MKSFLKISLCSLVLAGTAITGFAKDSTTSDQNKTWDITVQAQNIEPQTHSKWTQEECDKNILKSFKFTVNQNHKVTITDPTDVKLRLLMHAQNKTEGVNIHQLLLIKPMEFETNNHQHHKLFTLVTIISRADAKQGFGTFVNRFCRGDITVTMTPMTSTK